jgi:aromatic ring-opening dioxygenase LigB subunit
MEFHALEETELNSIASCKQERSNRIKIAAGFASMVIISMHGTELDDNPAIILKNI